MLFYYIINRIYLYAILFVCVIKLALPILGTVLPSLPGYRISYSLGYDTYLLRYTTAVLAIKDAIYLFQRTELFYFITWSRHHCVYTSKLLHLLQVKINTTTDTTRAG